MVPIHIVSILQRFSDDFEAVAKAVEKLKSGVIDTTNPLIAKYEWYKKQELPESQRLWKFIEGDKTVSPPKCVYFFEMMNGSDCMVAASHIEKALKPELQELFFALMSKIVYPRQPLAFHLAIGFNVVSYMAHFRRSYAISFRPNRSRKLKKHKELDLSDFTAMWMEWCNNHLLRGKFESERAQKKKHTMRLFSQIMWLLLCGCDQSMRNPASRIVIQNCT